MSIECLRNLLLLLVCIYGPLWFYGGIVAVGTVIGVSIGFLFLMLLYDEIKYGEEYGIFFFLHK
ncbi:MAG: hypothetical protein AAB710_00970 [Patescibacteria group bacterium]